MTDPLTDNAAAVVLVLGGQTGSEITLQSGSRVWVDGIGLTSRGKYRVDVRIATSDRRKAEERQ